MFIGFGVVRGRQFGCFLKVCEVSLEFLHDMGLRYCVSIAKWEEKNSEKEVVAHVANGVAFPNGGHIFNQLRVLMENGMCVGGMTLHFRFLECHDLIASYTLVTKGDVGALHNNFYP